MNDAPPTIEVQVNGDLHRVPVAALPDVLCALQYDPRQQGIAVALNAEVVPRSEWGATKISSGDRIEIVGAKQGG